MELLGDRRVTFRRRPIHEATSHEVAYALSVTDAMPTIMLGNFAEGCHGCSRFHIIEFHVRSRLNYRLDFPDQGQAEERYQTDQNHRAPINIHAKRTCSGDVKTQPSGR